jgi:hypothetical protein
MRALRAATKGGFPPNAGDAGRQVTVSSLSARRFAADETSGMEPLPPGSPPAGDDQDPVPVFGTWRRIYTAVILCALSVMGLLALFSSWKY